MKPLQIVRAVFNALQQPTLFSKGIAMQRSSPQDSPATSANPSPAAFRRHHSAVFIDASGYLNLAAHLSKSAMAEVGDVPVAPKPVFHAQDGFTTIIIWCKASLSETSCLSQHHQTVSANLEPQQHCKCFLKIRGGA